MRCLAVGLSAVLFACAASSAKHIPGGDGVDRVSIACVRDQTNCYERAAAECPNGFNVIGDTGYQNTAIIDPGNKWTGPKPQLVQSWHGSMMVACKGGKAIPPPKQPAGWYPDPRDATLKRYWDGRVWTLGPPGYYRDPEDGTRQRYWDGHSWEMRDAGISDAAGD